MIHSQGSMQGVGGITLFTQTWQPDGDEKAILALVHGIGEHSDRYANLVEHLVPRGYAIHTFDLRGHGRSQGKRGYINSWDEYRQDIKLFLSETQKTHADKKLFLMGHSLGGLMVLNYALHHPQGLAGVIASAPALAQTGVSPWMLTLARLLSSIAPAMTIKTTLDASMISRIPAVVEAYRCDPLVHDLGTPRLGTELAATMQWTSTRAAEFHLPLLILHGADDRIVPASCSRAFFENAPSKIKKRLEYPGGYHEPHNDLQASQAVQDIGDWLDAMLAHEQ